MNKLDLVYLHGAIRLALSCMIIAGLGRCALAANTNQDPAVVRHEACRLQQDRFDRVLGQAKGDPMLAEFQERLVLLDEVTQAVLDELNMWQMAGTPSLQVAPSIESAQVPPNGTQATINALHLVDEFQKPFSKELPLPRLSEADAQVMRSYYGIAARGLSEYLFVCCQRVIAINPQHADDALRLAIVLPLLIVPDESWSPAEVSRLPAWMREPTRLKLLEDFALHAQRPLLAYQFNTLLHSSVTASLSKMDVVAYLRSAGDQMFEEKDFSDGILCLRTAIQRADQEHFQDSIDLHFHLAEVLGDRGNSVLAADEVNQILQQIPAVSDHDYGRAVLLRLKYLYDAEHEDDLLHETDKYQSDKRCEPYLPQILYVSWCASRSINDTDRAARYSKSLLHRYPLHPLGADLYFAGAMESLSNGEYDQAVRQLQFIRYRYPKSELINKVEGIEQQLERTPNYINMTPSNKTSTTALSSK